MKHHPLYDNPNYIKLIKAHGYAESELKRIQKEEKSLWKQILLMEQDYRDKHGPSVDIEYNFD